MMLACILLVPPEQCSNNANPATNSTSQSIAQYMQQAETYFNKSQYTQAIEEYDIVLKSDPKNIDAYVFRAWSHIGNGAIDRASVDFSRVIELSPSSVKAFNGRGFCLANKAQWDFTSLTYLYQRFESDAGLAIAYSGRGWHYVKQEQWDMAVVPDPAKAAKQDTAIAEAYCNRAFAFFKKAQWDQAISDFDKMLIKDPQLNRDRWDRNWALSKKAQWDPVITDYDKVITILTGFSPPVYKPGEPDAQKENWRIAIDNYNKAGELAKDPALVQKAKNAILFTEKWYNDVKG